MSAGPRSAVHDPVAPTGRSAPAGEVPQEVLRRLFDARSARVGRRPQEHGADEAETTVLVVLRGADPAALVDGARRFAAGLPDAEAARWAHSWTRTRFLFGNPANVTGRVPARVTAANGGTAWLGPFAPGRLPGASRLLKPVSGRLPVLPAALDLPAPEPPAGPPVAARRLLVAVRDLTFTEYLVHLHHTVAESVLDGLLAPDEPLRLTHLPDLDGRTPPGEAAYARVHYAAGDPERLRLYAWLAPR